MPVKHSPTQDNNTNWYGDKIEKWQLWQIRSGIFAVVLIASFATAVFGFNLHPVWSLGGSFVAAVFAMFNMSLTRKVADILLAINMRR